MRGGQLVMEEMRSQAELDCPAAVGNCHDQISRKRVAKAELGGVGESIGSGWQKVAQGPTPMTWGTLRPSKVPSA